MAYTPRGPSIPCHPLLMYNQPAPWLFLPFQANKHQPKSETPDFYKYRSYFCWVNADTIRDTFKHTAQWGASVSNFPMKRHLKSRNPALNVPRRHEAVATDTVYSDTSAVDSGVQQAQLFVGKESLVSDIYPIRSSKQFVNTLEDNICRHGAMDKLISDSAKNEITTRSSTSTGHTTSVIGSLSHTIRIKTLLNGGIEPSRPGPTPS